MLTTFFATGDRQVDRFAAWTRRAGAGGVFIWSLIAYGGYCAFYCARYELSH